MKFPDCKATVIPSQHADCPDSYLVIGGRDTPVIRVGSKNDPSLQEMADALNDWARK